MKNIPFSDLKIGDIFIFTHEADGSPVYRFTSLFEKLNDSGQYISRGQYINDTRSNHRWGTMIPKIHGIAYKGTLCQKLSS